ncbi:MAG: tRNA preQ1(34) S-adenosylmethionine ribosyltransferase-isomerase QueA [Candidatus Dadabacteria bacterium]|nr:tRNA preQ1(34) S-adenosylmethionine ribosyltransferase-isomerase QueA [Candidatus Dadabacteria bacterium]MYA48470.1 tRNA preQ1(34) S-adenosylmethionine ribosyltransferase-isomerase QueA [Candidatus Dadabacteria bacterium]MYG82956.1 tRNA preQ1(34) S-adenosylmethionine ribosyltransferase-isomerase QueA [Candidatus Dadabacteria bacterium]MYK49952.1 tRNA preQ1(34) S-adenosylmethionine ribosyltransferase-isomerase QueA [Candidatus Dadabacteria bacterium]
MRTDQFDYDLPPRLIAHYPLSKRSSSRLLVVDRKTRRFSHARFSDLKDLLRRGDLMVLNNTRVIPARLAGHVERRGDVEFLLTERKDETRWKVLFKNPSEGLRVKLDGGVSGSLKREPDKSWTIRFSEPVERIISSTGQMPLPPYIPREPEPSDKKTYQTVYATEEGAVAAPTAGLHFDLELLSDLREKGVLMEYVTLHVGEGTFRPVKEELIDNHEMHSERVFVSEETARAVNKAKAEKRRVVSVGTTVTRTLESAMSEGGEMRHFSGRTDLFIRPPYEFRFVDVLITNFHMPRSTLLMLVSAFCGTRELALAAYEEAKLHDYRFLSYGDSMIIV